MQFAQIGRLYCPPPDERPTTQKLNTWASRAANVQGVISSIAPFVLSHGPRGGSAPVHMTPRTALQFKRASSVRQPDGQATPPPFARGEVVSYLAQHATPEVPGYHVGSTPPPPLFKFNSKHGGVVGPRTPPRVNSIEHESNPQRRVTGEEYERSGFLYPKDSRRRTPAHDDDDVDAENPFNHDLIDEDEQHTSSPEADGRPLSTDRGANPGHIESFEDNEAHPFNHHRAANPESFEEHQATTHDNHRGNNEAHAEFDEGDEARLFGQRGASPEHESFGEGTPASRGT